MPGGQMPATLSPSEPINHPEPTVESTEVPPLVAPAAAAGRPDTVWVWQVTALSLVLGVMLALAMTTTTQIRKLGLPGSRMGLSAQIAEASQEKNQQLQDEIKELRSRLSETEKSVGNESRAVERLKKELQDLKTQSGLAPVEGPGIKITLRDSTETRLPNLSPEEMEGYLVHDQDINGVISELKAAGAEALAISGADPKNLQRVVVTTTARCVGPVATINGAQLSAPYTILAIGNPKDLHSALEMPNGYIENRGLKLLKMYTIEESEHLVLPEFSGTFSPKYARPTASSQ
jgi:uncharacterized protein YlxW (UPF0749 family)